MIDHSDFSKNFNRTRKLAKGIIVFNAVIILAVIVVIAALGVNILTNPESVGQFFGKILHGFNSVK